MTVQKLISWEAAVRWYRAQPNNEAAIRDNYFDLPVKQAAERYARGEEFAEVIHLLGQGNGSPLLDFGAGNGIASYALAIGGWEVTALDPDPGEEVGAGAIRSIAAETTLPIQVVRGCGEKLPFRDSTFAAIHARQALHHTADLHETIRELARVLCPSGLILATREHVADDEAQLATFRASHPLHHLYGGENAYSLPRYREAFAQAGLRVRTVWGPLESILNFYPGVEATRQAALRRVVKRSWFGLGYLLVWSDAFRASQIKWVTRRDRTPGRIFSFLLEKP